jgi:hypothetical protein
VIIENYAIGILMDLWRVRTIGACATVSTTVAQNLMELGPKIL